MYDKKKSFVEYVTSLFLSLCENCSAKAMYYSWTCPECLTAEMQTKSFLKYSHIQHIQCTFKNGRITQAILELTDIG